MSNVVFDYLIEAQFISFFNNYWIRREVKDVVRDTVDDIIIGEIIEDYLDRILLEAVPIICQGELNAEMKRYYTYLSHNNIGKIKQKYIMHLESI
jgi:hypothetical protein